MRLIAASIVLFAGAFALAVGALASTLYAKPYGSNPGGAAMAAGGLFAIVGFSAFFIAWHDPNNRGE